MWLPAPNDSPLRSSSKVLSKVRELSYFHLSPPAFLVSAGQSLASTAAYRTLHTALRSLRGFGEELVVLAGTGELSLERLGRRGAHPKTGAGRCGPARARAWRRASPGTQAGGQRETSRGRMEEEKKELPGSRISRWVGRRSILLLIVLGNDQRGAGRDTEASSAESARGCPWGLGIDQGRAMRHLLS